MEWHLQLVMWVALRYTGYDRLPNTISGSTETVVDTGSITSRVSSIHDRYVDKTWNLDFSPSAYLNDSYALLHLVFSIASLILLSILFGLLSM